ncbi:methyltransferase domain-containing protein [Methanosphaera sp. WGK6]|uniref:methyltransferase domain-containing protein n=1 Tax=Methanosphaera sp. WGK6 TaxID=1561964 RepID=UPI00084C9AA5|nr:methyltransferase domain-containing protein [Methanosphaera sp. WGK6]
MNEHLDENTIKGALKKQQAENCVKIDPDIGTIQCNICGYESEFEFLHYGKSNRRNEKCPVCNTFQRTRLLWYYLEKYTDVFERDNLKILNNSPQNKIYHLFKEKYGDNYIASDIEERECVDEVIDIQNIPYEDNTFDLIISSHVLEHVPDDKKAMREFYRVLKPNGMVIILIPSLYSLTKTFELPQINTPTLKERYNKQHDHLRYYSVDNLFKDLEDIGFTTLRKNYVPGKKNPEDMKKHALSADPLFVGVKKINKENKTKLSTINKETNSNNYCTICDKEVTFKNNPDLDKICPNCNSNSDERLVYEKIKNDLKQNPATLYINPEKVDNPIQQFNIEKKEDISDNTLHLLKSFKNNSLDIIILLHVLDKSEDDKKIIKELYRILKPNGKLLLKENMDLELTSKIDEDFLNTPKLRRLFNGNENAIRCYGIDLIHILEFMEFEIEYDDPEKQKNNIKLKNRLTKDPLIICTKN